MSRSIYQPFILSALAENEVLTLRQIIIQKNIHSTKTTHMIKAIKKLIEMGKVRIVFLAQKTLWLDNEYELVK